MIPIQIHMLEGTHAGRARLFDEPQLAFGRTADNHIVIDIPEASRHHGALVLDTDHWTVVNNSPNGTTVNGKKLSKKNAAIKTGDQIGVGKTRFFSVEIMTPHQPAPAAAQTGVTTERQATSGRSKLWIGIGIYFVVMLVGFVVLSQLAGDGPKNKLAPAPYLTPEQIEAEITAAMTLSPSDRDAQEALKKALTQYQQVEVDIAARYNAYHQFKRADAFSQGSLFNDPNDAQAAKNYRLYKNCERDLVDAITEQYRSGYNFLRAGQSEQAERAFRKLQAMYPNHSSDVYRNVTRQIKVARSKRAR